jgi:hypothetical protein
MAQPPKSSRYERRAFLVRLWRDSPMEPWRASAQPAPQAREIYFSSPEKLFLFLHDQLAEQTAQSVNDPQISQISQIKPEQSAKSVEVNN